MNKRLNQELGAILQKLRLERKLTVREVASKLKKGHSTVSAHELGKIAISLDVFYEYCDLYDVDPSAILKELNYKQK